MDLDSGESWTNWWCVGETRRNFRLSCVPLHNSPVEVFTPQYFSICLGWRQGLYRGNLVKVRSLGWALIQYGCSFYKKGKFGYRDLHTQWQIGARRWPSISQRERRGTNPFLMPLKREQPCQHLDFMLRDARTERQYTSVVQTTQSVVLGCSSPSKQI